MMTSDTALRSRRMLGWGPKLTWTDAQDDIGQDIEFANGDIAQVSGMDALIQDLRAALCTGLGSDPLNPAFGSDAFAAMVEETDPMTLRERIRVAVIRVLQADPRVRRVVEVRIDGEAQPFAAPSASPPATERRTGMSVLAVFETALSESATIAIEGLSHV